jgi:hypothetical protein
LLNSKTFPHVASTFIILFFVGGVVNHSFGFAGINTTKPVLWHGYNILMCKLGILAVLSKHPIGFWWLLTIFITEIPVELKGTFESYGSSMFGDQVVEVILNLICITFVLLTRKAYFRAPSSVH